MPANYDSLLCMPGSGLYAITPSNLASTALVQAVTAAIEGGAVLIQYRAKEKPPEQRRREATELNALCKEFNVPLLLNDDLALARELRCGVHLGEADATVSEARQLLGARAIIGASCYDSVVLAQRAVESGASYLAFGAFFPTQSKAQTRQAEPQILAKAKVFGLPLVAIGGLTPENAEPLVHAGADYLAAIDSVFSDPEKTRAQAERFTALFATIPKTTP